MAQKTEVLHFAFYGKLRSTHRYGRFLPKPEYRKEIAIPQFKLYRWKSTVGIVQSIDPADKIHAQLVTFKLTPWQKWILISILDILEGSPIGRYRRITVKLKNKQVWIYAYNWKLPKIAQKVSFKDANSPQNTP